MFNVFSILNKILNCVICDTVRAAYQKDECKFHPLICHESMKLSLFFNLGSKWQWVVNIMPWFLYAWETPSTHFTGG